MSQLRLGKGAARRNLYYGDWYVGEIYKRGPRQWALSMQGIYVHFEYHDGRATKTYSTRGGFIADVTHSFRSAMLLAQSLADRFGLTT